MYGNNPLTGLYGGIQIIDTEMVGDAYEDWSAVRSRGRATRRRRYGHPQRIVTRYRANGKCIHDKARNVIYMHPHDRMRFETVMRQKGSQ
jgi:hypothetical protein